MPQRIREATATAVGAQIAVIGMMAATQVLVSRSLGPESYGLYSVMVGSIAVTAALANAGVSWSTPRVIADFDAKGDNQGVAAAYGAALRFEAIALLLTIVVLALLTPLLMELLFQGEVVLQVGLIFGTLFLGVHAVYSSVLLGLREIRYVALARLARAVAVLVLIAALAYGFDLRLTSAAVAYALSPLAAAAAAVVGVRLVAAGRLRPTRRRLPEFRSFAAVVTLNSVYENLITISIPVLVSLLIADSEREFVGYAALLAGLGLVANNFLLSIFQAGYPYMTRWQAVGDTRNVMRFFGYALAMTLVMYAGGLIVGTIWGEGLLADVYGEGFRPAATHIEVAVLSMFLFSMHRLVSFVLYALGKQNRVLKANVLGFMVLLTSLLSLGLGTEASPVDVVFVSTAVASATSIVVNSLLSFRERLLIAGGAAGQRPAINAEVGTGGFDYDA